MISKLRMNGDIKIGKECIGLGYPCFIIAEAGVNHNGSLKLAKKLVDAAKKAGADAMKFQTFKTEELVTEKAPQAEYQKKNVNAKSQFEMLKKLELSESEFREIFKYCEKKKIIFLSTPFDEKSAEFLNILGVPAFKIGSGDITNIPLIRTVSEFGKPVILSSGMSTLAEVADAVKAIYKSGNHKLVLLHCTSNYPAEFNSVNLMAMDTLKNKFHVPVGYSDHTPGIEIAIAAVARGARVIEKHFTLSKDMKGPDHKASLEPDELKKMIDSIRNVEISLGTPEKKPVRSERRIKDVVRKSIVSSVDMPKGTKIKRDIIAFKRPGSGIPPTDLDRVLDKTTKMLVKKDQLLKPDMLK